MTEQPTEQERRTLNETLARAMGICPHKWIFAPDNLDGDSDYPEKLCEFCGKRVRGLAYRVDGKVNAPDFTRDPAARDELVRWLAADDARWREFAFRLFDLVGAWPPQALDSVARKLLTADPLVIARAAVEAIGGSND